MASMKCFDPRFFSGQLENAESRNNGNEKRERCRRVGCPPVQIVPPDTLHWCKMSPAVQIVPPPPANCAEWFHLDCINAPAAAVEHEDMPWKCPTCH